MRFKNKNGSSLEFMRRAPDSGPEEATQRRDIIILLLFSILHFPPVVPFVVLFTVLPCILCTEDDQSLLVGAHILVIASMLTFISRWAFAGESSGQALCVTSGKLFLLPCLWVFIVLCPVFFFNVTFTIFFIVVCRTTGGMCNGYRYLVVF